MIRWWRWQSGQGNGNSRIVQKTERVTRASHTILEAYLGGEMPKEVGNLN